MHDDTITTLSCHFHDTIMTWTNIRSRTVGHTVSDRRTDGRADGGTGDGRTSDSRTVRRSGGRSDGHSNGARRSDHRNQIVESSSRFEDVDF